MRHHFRSRFLQSVLLPLGDWAMGTCVSRRLRFLAEAQWWPTERLARERDLALASLVQVAYAEVPFYRDLMDRARVQPREIRGTGDLARLPIVTKAMLRANYPDRTVRPTGQRTYEASTSGSTGTNFRVVEDAQTAGHRRAAFMLALLWSGWEIGEAHLQMGMSLRRDTPRRLKDFFLGCHYVSAYDLSDRALDANLRVIDEHKLQCVWGYPGSIFFLARRALSRGWNRKVKSVVTWGDNLFPSYRKTIEDAFRTRVIDTYGCAEGIQVAAQCDQARGYHVHMLNTVAEFLDDTGAPVPPGQRGRVILTRLFPGPMPLIRYEVGDVGSAAGQERCPCGRGFELMRSIDGRMADVVLTPGGNRLIVHFFTGILEHFPEIDTFQVVQETAEDLRLNIVPTPRWTKESAARICSALAARGTDGMKIQVQTRDEIPLTAGGKRRFIINQAFAAHAAPRDEPFSS